jgi:hypothetical protein
MERWVTFEVIAQGKMDEYNEWFEARDKRFQELGMARLKKYQVQARTQRMVCVVTPEMTAEEGQQWRAQYWADEVIAELARERYGTKAVVDGTTEFYWLTTD